MSDVNDAGVYREGITAESEALWSCVLGRDGKTAGDVGRLCLGTAISSKVLDKVFESFVDTELEARLRLGLLDVSSWLPRRPRGFALVWYAVVDILRMIRASQEKWVHWTVLALL